MRELPRSLIRSLEQQGEGLGVLVLRLGAMGDILRTLPAVRLFRATLPRCRIHWVLDDRWRLVVEGHPDLNGIVPLARGRFDRAVASPSGWADLPGTLGELRRNLRALEGRLALDFHGNLRSGLVGWLSGAAVRVGYSGHQQKEGNRLLTTHRVPSGDRRTPRVERNLELVRALGVRTRQLPRLDLPLARAGADDAEEVLARTGAAGSAVAVLSSGASTVQAYKIPPPELFAAACAELNAAGLRVLVVWGPGEQETARAVVQRVSGEATCLAPATSLAALAALLARGRLFVGADSGPLHLACAVGCPVVGIYGPTDPQVNRPWGVPYRTVQPPGREYTGIKRIDRRRGFEGLRESDVRTAIADLLGELESVT